MMRGKSPPSEPILEIIKSNNSLKTFIKNLEMEIISFLSKYDFVLFLQVYFKKRQNSAK